MPDVTLDAYFPSANDGPLVVAHRGASADAPENTLAAFRLAWEHGADGIEGDFHLTADRRIVCIHDSDTKRTTGKSLVVAKSSLDELQSLDAGSWKAKHFAGEKIPTLEEVIETVPDGRLLVIELKSDSKVVPVLADVLSRPGTDRIRVLLIAFDEETTRLCKQRLPDVRVHWLTKFNRSTPLSRYRPGPDKIASVVRSCNADGVGMKAMRSVVNEKFVASLRRSGCAEFHVFTVDSADDARYFRDIGAMGITTNRPRAIRAAL